MRVLTNNLGYPRIGEKRELKKATESFWKGQISADELKQTAKNLRLKNWKTQKEAGIGLIPSNDFSFYDQMLDMSCLLGVVPPRFKWDGKDIDLDIRFLMARGMKGEGQQENSAPASEMTKWFDTNYHYIVPEFYQNTQFKLSSQKIFDEFKEAKEQGIATKPVLIGPVTFLMLGKAQEELDKLSLLEKVLPIYIETLQRLEKLGAEWVQIDEPVLALDLTAEQRTALAETYKKLVEAVPALKLMVASYFGDVRDNLKTFLELPVNALHIDAVRGRDEAEKIINQLPADKILSIGAIDGRNIWKNDFEQSLSLLQKAKEKLGEHRIMVAPSCSLIHSPVTLRNEEKLDAELKNWLAFAEEKLTEVATLAKALSGEAKTELEANQKAIQSRRTSKRVHNQDVKGRCAKVSAKDLKRASTFQSRQEKQAARFKLPEFPTTTIGSFPQTPEVRSARAKFRKGEISQAEYDKFVETETQKVVKIQEEIGIDVLVHGEFERNDMVEYFGELLEGFTFTQHGWVQSYGSRYVKPPVIFGDVLRPKPMTVRWSKLAQSLTKKPMKGMLTGPITILQWSFVRDDQPRSETAKQIALALRDEVSDLEAAGIGVIQIDEPALREGLPLRRADWEAYLRWSVDAFRLSSSSVRDETQIHTHMCYAEFNDIVEAIAELDADVISIETSRSNMELLQAFGDFKYPNEIGPGVYDIHSPRVPSVDEMVNLLAKAEEVLPRRNVWVNPDCGLKTRQWEETTASLKNMVAAAQQMRSRQPAAAA